MLDITLRAPASRFQVGFLIALIFFDFMGMATVVVQFPQLFLNPASGLLPADWDNGVRVVALGFCLAIYPLGQFFGAILFGKWSDHVGRRPALTFSLFGTVLGFALSAVAVSGGLCWLLFASRLLAGLCAGNVTVAQASLADLSIDEQDKAQHLALGQMAMGAAYIAGPVLGGIVSDPQVLGWFDVSTPFWLLAAILGFMLLLARIAFRETALRREQGGLPIGQGLRQVAQAFAEPGLRLGFLGWFVFIAGWWLFESFVPAFLYQVFHFDTAQIGHLLAYNGGLYLVFQYLVVRRTIRFLTPFRMFAGSGLVVGIAVASIAFVHGKFGLYALMSVFVMGMGYAITGFITTLSERGGVDRQGQVMGMVGSVQAIATVLVMMGGGYLNAAQPALPLLCGGTLIALSWLIFLRAFRGQQAAQEPALPVQGQA